MIRREVVLLLFMWMLCLWPLAVAADYDEYNVKSAFVYHFCRFSEWTETNSSFDSGFKIAVVGGSDFSDALQKNLEGKAVHKSHIKVTVVKHQMDLTGFHVLVVPEKIDEVGRSLLKQSQSLAIMTISDDMQAMSLGLMVQLFIENEKVRFRINSTLTSQQGIQISSRLLKLADKVL